MTSDEIMVQRLNAARVHVVRSKPGSVVLEMTGAADALHFIMTIEDLSRLAQRLTQDAALLGASGGTIPPILPTSRDSGHSPCGGLRPSARLTRYDNEDE